MAKLKIEDLKKIKEKVKGTVNLREGNYRVKVTVHGGTCGISAGSRTLSDTLITEVEKSGVSDILIASSGCAGLCSEEPMITVEVKESAPVKYVRLTPEKVIEIYNEHVINGRFVEKYAIVMGSENTHAGDSK